MKKFIIFFIIFSTPLFAESWTTTSFREDEEFQYWVGISNEQTSEKLALSEAYQEALNEAAKFNFGFKHKVVENTYANKNEHQVHQETEWQSEKILFKGIKPLRQKVTERKGKYIAYREISYPKKEIREELSRLKKISSEPDVSNVKLASKSYTYGIFKVTSNVSNIQVQLIKSDSPEVNSFTFPGETTLATGRYYLTATKEGHKPLTKEIIITGGENFTHLELESTLATLSLKVNPQDAKILVNGKHYLKPLIDLAEGLYRIEVSHPNFLTSIEEIELINGSGVFREITLKPKKSSITIISEPSRAQVFINGAKAGETPLINHSFLSEEKTLDITLIKEGYELSSRNFEYLPNTPLEPINFNLKKIER